MIGRIGSTPSTRPPNRLVAIDASTITPEQRDTISLDSSVILFDSQTKPKVPGKKARDVLSTLKPPPKPSAWPSQLRLVGIAGVDSLLTAKNPGDFLKAAAELGGSGIGLASKAAKFQGAARLATGLGVAGIWIDGSIDLVRGVHEKDPEALALAGLKGAAGALLLVPGGAMASGGVMLGATALENREWLAEQIGNGWNEVSKLWQPPPQVH